MHTPTHVRFKVSSEAGRCIWCGDIELALPLPGVLQFNYVVVGENGEAKRWDVAGVRTIPLALVEHALIVDEVCLKAGAGDAAAEDGEGANNVDDVEDAGVEAEARPAFRLISFSVVLPSPLAESHTALLHTNAGLAGAMWSSVAMGRLPRRVGGRVADTFRVDMWLAPQMATAERLAALRFKFAASAHPPVPQMWEAVTDRTLPEALPGAGSVVVAAEWNVSLPNVAGLVLEAAVPDDSSFAVLAGGHPVLGAWDPMGGVVLGKSGTGTGCAVVAIAAHAGFAPHGFEYKYVKVVGVQFEWEALGGNRSSGVLHGSELTEQFGVMPAGRALVHLRVDAAFEASLPAAVDVVASLGTGDGAVVARRRMLRLEPDEAFVAVVVVEAASKENVALRYVFVACESGEETTMREIPLPGAGEYVYVHDTWLAPPPLVGVALRVSATPHGSRALVCGPTPQLGRWDPARAPVLSADNAAVLWMHPNAVAKLEYKLAALDEGLGGAYVWENCSTRKVPPTWRPPISVVHAVFDDAPVQVDVYLDVVAPLQTGHSVALVAGEGATPVAMTRSAPAVWSTSLRLDRNSRVRYSYVLLDGRRREVAGKAVLACAAERRTLHVGETPSVVNDVWGVASGQFVLVKFAVQLPSCGPSSGLCVAVSGSLPLLGQWDPAAAVRMRRAGENEYRVALNLPYEALRQLEYKYVIVDEHAPTASRWEARGNRSVVPGIYTSLWLRDAWVGEMPSAPSTPRISALDIDVDFGSQSDVLVVPVHLAWRHGGRSGFVRGSFTSPPFERRLPLGQASDGSLSLRLGLVPGRYQVVFEVDGVTRFASYAPMEYVPTLQAVANVMVVAPDAEAQPEFPPPPEDVQGAQVWYTQEEMAEPDLRDVRQYSRLAALVDRNGGLFSMQDSLALEDVITKISTTEYVASLSASQRAFNRITLGELLSEIEQPFKTPQLTVKLREQAGRSQQSLVIQGKRWFYWTPEEEAARKRSLVAAKVLIADAAVAYGSAAEGGSGASDAPHAVPPADGGDGVGSDDPVAAAVAAARASMARVDSPTAERNAVLARGAMRE
ncbi:uncharacterized protein AMSG_10762 [Thecamonas trahens ATCC 50062]|uniref:CBM20 domain-containing protein n=1 Tax=Thecamonas trahens ATCC 50062 TaxID=461836 RepID=A0A0L0DUK6_THETB|nr:hypothetical protein AMSG_10762 [Thecamonas trahens ATCC 50062]KNC55153.1 hypothetical protein AMSG_10762 [Thecamonas trahens ATCC 50062]|eukprot:XP_013753208.1 hypothetical protein AMSG_10762 [Thecamonas trahens ATCC 50062]